MPSSLATGSPSPSITVWTGTGKLLAIHATSIQHEPELFLNAIFHGVFQFEGAATGTVSDGFQNFTPDTTNQAPFFRFGNEKNLDRYLKAR